MSVKRLKKVDATGLLFLKMQDIAFLFSPVYNMKILFFKD
jgi:hypothetical protein